MTPEEIAGVLAQLLLWVESASARLTAQEEIIREKLGITDAEWEQALAKARQALPEPSLPSGAAALASIEDFLKRLTKR